MEYITRTFENTSAGLRQKDATTRELAGQGYRIISEQIEQGHIKGSEQCCGALICLPLIFLAGRTPGNIIVTYGRESFVPEAKLYCTSCGSENASKATFCVGCGINLIGKSTPDQAAALFLIRGKQVALELAAAAHKSIDKLDRILIDNLEIDDRFDWNSLVKNYPISEPRRKDPKLLPSTPQWSDFVPRLSLLELVIPPLRNKKYEAARRKFQSAASIWEKTKEQHDMENTALDQEFEQARSQWGADKRTYEEVQAVDGRKRRELHLAKDSAVLNEYWKAVCDRSGYFEKFPNSHEFDYLPESRILIAEYDLPSIECLPRVQDVRFVESRKEFENIQYPETWLKDFYNRVIYKIALSTMYALFQSDTVDAVDRIVFNGNVRAIDPATGHKVNSCIISVQASKSDFMAMRLSQVDPQACFKRLNGVSSGNMADIAPIVPLQRVTERHL